MTIASLSDVTQHALKNHYSVAGLVVLGWEDARSFVTAAELESAPVILQAGPSCRAHTPLRVLGEMFRTLAESASVPVVAHLDHGRTFDECKAAINCGFTSVMFDGSALPLAHNIEQTRAVVKLAHSNGVSCEGELGIVGYAGDELQDYTDPKDAELFVRETGVDALAVAIGNVHLQQNMEGVINVNALRKIEAVTGIPIVIHGTSGIPIDMRKYLASESNVCKFNIGTELRMHFGSSLRSVLKSAPERFDRIAILKEVEASMTDVAREVIRSLKCA